MDWSTYMYIYIYIQYTYQISSLKIIFNSTILSILILVSHLYMLRRYKNWPLTSEPPSCKAATWNRVACIIMWMSSGAPPVMPVSCLKGNKSRNQTQQMIYANMFLIVNDIYIRIYIRWYQMMCKDIKWNYDISLYFMIVYDVQWYLHWWYQYKPVGTYCHGLFDISIETIARY